MLSLPLASTGRTTTQLGFGCSSIMGSIGRRQSLALLETAFDAGIRHFDTAPLYGFGEAEGCVGEFLARHPGDITVATKFGMPPVRLSPLKRTARNAAAALAGRLPAGLRRRLRPTAAPQPAAQTSSTEPAPNPIFTAANCDASLTASLQALRTGHVDLFLLHEVNPVDLANSTHGDRLLATLQNAVQGGRIGAFGVGSERASIPGLLAQHPAYTGVTQYAWSALDLAVAPGAPFRIHHRALSSSFQALQQILEREPTRASRWSEAVGQDLRQPGMLASLMLKAALELNPDSIVLFSSKNPVNIQRNVVVAADATLAEPARRLYALFQQEPPLPAG